MKQIKILALFFIYLSIFSIISCDEAVKETPKETPKEEPKEDSNDDFTAEERELLKQNEEKFNFNVEVTRLMDIIINSLYTNKEVFIRESLYIQIKKFS